MATREHHRRADPPADARRGGPAASRRRPAPARTGTRSRRSARSRASSPWARSAVRTNRLACSPRGHRLPYGIEDDTPQIHALGTGDADLRPGHRWPVRPGRAGSHRPPRVPGVLRGPTATGEPLSVSISSTSTVSTLPTRSSARCATSSSARSAIRLRRSSTRSSGAVMIEPNGLGALLVGVAEDADGVHPGLDQEVGEHLDVAVGLPGEPDDHVAPDAGLGHLRIAPGRSGPGTSPRPRSDASGAARVRWRAGTTGRSTAPRRGSSR